MATASRDGNSVAVWQQCHEVASVTIWQRCHMMATVSRSDNSVSRRQQCRGVTTASRDGNSVTGWEQHHGMWPQRHGMAPQMRVPTTVSVSVQERRRLFLLPVQTTVRVDCSLSSLFIVAGVGLPLQPGAGRCRRHGR